MPTSQWKSVTIALTPRQKEKLRKLTGQAHSEIRVDWVQGRASRKPLSAKVAPTTRAPLPIPPDNTIHGLPTT